MKIDFENHYITMEIMDAMSRNYPHYPYHDKEKGVDHLTPQLSAPVGDRATPQLFTAERIEHMDAHGIDKAVICPSGGLERLHNVADGIASCKASNDAAHAYIQQYPDRLLGSAVLPVQDIDAACEELERCVKELGFVAWHTHSNYGPDHHIDDPEYWPILAKVEELGIYVSLHPDMPRDERLHDYGFPLAAGGLGLTLDVLITVTRMIISGLFDKYPNLKILLGHLGECFPYMIDRMDDRLTAIPNPYIKNKHPLQYYFKHNIWVSTSGNASAPAFACCKEVLGLDRIVFATDYSHEDLGKAMAFLDSLPLTAEEKEQLFEGNARNLIPSL